jgi:hypothetical protein
MLLDVSVSTKVHMAQSETEYKVSGETVRIGKEAVRPVSIPQSHTNLLCGYSLKKTFCSMLKHMLQF